MCENKIVDIGDGYTYVINGRVIGFLPSVYDINKPEEGIAECRCTCGDVWTETIPALGHAWDDGVITKEPTDTESGVKTYTCTRCGETKEENGHYEKRETKKAWDEERLVSVNICNQCGMEFSAADYDSFDDAVDATLTHIFDSQDNGGDCDNYRTETRTITIHHDAEIVHHPAEYKTVTVKTKVSRTCKKCQKHQERAEFENELE